MFKSKLFVAVAALLFTTVLKAQTITIDNARFDLPAGYSYSSSGSIAIPITVDNGCLKFVDEAQPALNNKLSWQLCDVAGNPVTGANAYRDSISVIYATFINTRVKTTTPNGNYKFKVWCSTTAATPVFTNAFSLSNAMAVDAMAVPVNRDRILLDQYYYGRCDGVTASSMALIDSSTSGSIDSLDLVDNYRANTPVQKLVPDASKVFNITFVPTELGHTGYIRDAYYTAFVKSIKGTIVSTKSYHVINNRWNIFIFNPKAGLATRSSCKGDSVSVKIQIDTTQTTHLQQNFPAALINIDWADGSKTDYTICSIIANNGVVKHVYSQTACERTNGNNSGYDIKATVKNPFNIVNGPGITGTCGPGAISILSTQLFSPPKAKFLIDSVVCGNGTDSLLLKNTSDPGQAAASTNVNGSSANCAKLANYTWIIDNVTAPKPYYHTPDGKVEGLKDTSRKFTAAEAGYHSIKLFVTNQYGDDAPCPTSDTTTTICVDTATIKPVFQMVDSSSATPVIVNDSIIACSPTVYFVNQTRRTFCLDSTHFKYRWSIHDATKPFNIYDTLKNPPGSPYYQYKNGSHFQSMFPTISFEKKGKYYVALRIKGKCDTTIAMIKYVEATGDAGVKFVYDSVFNCSYSSSAPSYVLSFNPSVTNTNLYTRIDGINKPIARDSVKYQYDPATAGALSFKWVVLPNTPGAWQFVNGTTDTDSTPQIQFNQKGTYTIIDSFKNNCAVKGKIATQIFVYQEAPAASTTSSGTDTICRNSNTPLLITGYSVDLTKNDSVFIVWKGRGSFNPPYGILTKNVSTTTPNILTPTFTPSAEALITACQNGYNGSQSGGNIGLLTYDTMVVSSAINIACTSVSARRPIYITPCIPSNNITLNLCSCSPLNYSITNPPNTLFRWTRVDVLNVSGSTAGSGGNYVSSINDVLCLINSSQSGYVEYQVYPKSGNCDGDPYIVHVDVRPVPANPGVTYVTPPQPPNNSICSGEQASFSFNNGNTGDTYCWTTYSFQGLISGNTPACNQPTFPGHTLINSSLTKPDTAVYIFKTVSSYSCTGPSDSVTVIVNPAHPQAVIYNKGGGQGTIYKCDSTCLLLRGNDPTNLGTGTWTFVKSYPVRLPTPTLTQVAGDSVWMACDMQPNTEYIFTYCIAPKNGGSCRTKCDTLSVYIADSVSNVFGLRDTILCDVSGLVTRNYQVCAQLSRGVPASEFYLWSVKPNTTTSSVSPNGGLCTNYSFSQPGVDSIIFCAKNVVCPAKCDTGIVKLYKPPLGVNNLSLTPSQINDRYCQGSNVTVTAALNPKEDDLYYWIIRDYPSMANRVDSITTTNPFTINNLQRDIIVTAVVRTKGWTDGCRDTALSIDKIIYVDSPSIAGSLFSKDTIVCAPGNKALIELRNYRGNDITWIASTTGCAGPYSSLPGIPSGSNVITPTIPSTIWYKAVVKNGNCSPDTTACIQIYIPTSSGNATIFNADTAVCGTNCITLTGNTPPAGIGYWSAIVGYNNSGTGTGCINLFPASFDTAVNPINVDITTKGMYKFVWTIKNFSCPASKDTVTVISTQPLANNTISASADTVCKGTVVNLTGSVPTGGGYYPNTVNSNIQYSWEISKDGGATWNTVGTIANSYTFPGDTTVKIRRYLTSDSCKSSSNIIDLVVDQPVTNNIITAPSQVCTGTLSSLITGSTPGGGNGSYTYAWDTASMTNSRNGLWSRDYKDTISYNPYKVLYDSLAVRRIVTSGKCVNISDSVVYIINPDAKARYTVLKSIDCAPFNLATSIPVGTPAPFTNYAWTFDTVGGTPYNQINTGIGFGGYTIAKGLDSARICLIASSAYTPQCKSDTMCTVFKTLATPFASFTISADSGCAIGTANASNFTLTNTTPNKNLFPNHNWTLGAYNNPNYNGADFPPGFTLQWEGSATGLDKQYTISLAVGSLQCSTSTVSKTITIRTKPKVKYYVQPANQCSGGIVTFYDQSTAVNADTKWIFGDAGNTVGSTTPDSTQHLYNSTKLTTYYSVLKRQNECDMDSAIQPVTIDANTNITVQPQVEIMDKYQCVPATVRLYSHSSGGVRYQWNFGDGNSSPVSFKDKDTVVHTFNAPGKYLVALTGYTFCGSVTKYDTVYVYGKPSANFTVSPNNTICKGDTAKFVFVDTFYSKVFSYGSGEGTGSLNYHVYPNTGSYNVQLIASNSFPNPTGGPVIQCWDTSFAQTVIVRDSLPGTFAIRKIGTSCIPDIIDLINTTSVSTKPYTTNWTFGTPLLLPQSGDSVRIQYNIAGTYNIAMVIKNAKGCIYTAEQQRVVIGPFGDWTIHDTVGYKCGSDTVHFSYSANNTDSIAVNYGDGISETFAVSPASNSFYHIYTKGGTYYPTATLISNAGSSGCTFPLPNYGPVRVDYVTASFRIDTTQNCGNTVIRYINTSTMDQSPAQQSTMWTINGNIGRTRDTTVTYYASSTVPDTVHLVTTSISGCKAYYDTLVMVKVHNIPNVLSVNRRDTACLGDTIRYETFIAASEDPVTKYNYVFGNSTQLDNGTNPVAYTTYGTVGTKTDKVTVSTSFCSFNYTIPRALVINDIPIVGINPNTPQSICYLVDTVTLTANASGSLPVKSYSWSPNFGIAGSTTAQSVRVSPTDNITYTVTVTNSAGCTNKASQTVNVIQPYTLKINDGKDTAICNGTTLKLTVTASNGVSHDYSWINPQYIQPDTAQRDTSTIIVKPPINQVYTVIDRNAQCPDPTTGVKPKASIQVLVGDSFNITFSADTITLQAGTKYTFTPNYGTQDSMKSIVWSPNLYFTTSDQYMRANPEILVTDNICYNVKATSIYNCADDANICVKAFCEASQVFIPNTFTPDGNGQNDRFYVTANGIKRVVSFRVFNRWGQVVYERANYQPSAYRSLIYNPGVAWDGKFNGVIAPTDTYVYTCEVECQNGTRYTYTGSVSLLK